jgi:hypothetical protein
MRGRNYTKLFSIVGIIFGEIYMLYTVLAPYRKGPPIPINVPMPHETLPADLAIPTGALVLKIALCSVFFGLFGALVGLGIGLIVTGLLAKRPPQAP